MQIGSGEHTYTWHEHWATIPDTPSGKQNGRTHAVVVVPDGRVVVFNQADPGVLIFDGDGELIGSWGDRFIGAHGMTLIEEDGEPRLWLVDQQSFELCKTTVEGEVLQRLDLPPKDQWLKDTITTTWADRNPANGDIWVADGYGGSAVFRYSADGTYRGRLTGEEGAGRFACPHGLRFGPDGMLYIADRGNQRITVYDGEGNHVRQANGVCHSPCGFDFRDGLILVPELFTGVKLLDRNFNVVAELGANPEVVDTPRPEGWPNLAGTDHVQPGKFNSPHGACFAPNGDIYVVEWIIGGRITKLEKSR